MVQLERWLDPVPRVTKDLDIVVGLDLICSTDAQARMSRVLRDCGFEVTGERPRWQFQKKLGGDHAVLVDFHACPPESGEKQLRTNKVRVKHSPSLGEGGIHGRRNPEAVGSELHPFSFETDGVVITVPNPVTWCNMKLTAMRDRWRRAEDQARSEDHRRFQRDEAIKHARDVCRVVAMTTREENDGASEVVEAIRATSAFSQAASIFAEFFGRNDGWGTRATKPMWQDEDARLIGDVLAGWFGP